MIHTIKEETQNSEPTVEQVRDHIQKHLTTINGWESVKTKPNGKEEVVVFHPNGKKFVVTVKELNE
jgi:hypothetical protein